MDGRFDLSEIRVVNIEEPTEELTVYPNPTHDFVNVSASLNYETASVYNINGQLIKNVSLGEEIRIDLSDLDGGTYFVKVSSSSGDVSDVMRIVKL